MKKERVILIIVVTFLAVILINTFSQQESPQAYLERIEKSRRQKDIFFLSDESPLSEAQKKTFEGLKYYPPNPDFRIKADLIKIDNPGIVKLATSDGVTKEYTEFGQIKFEHGGKQHSLLAFEMPEPFEDQLFLPFADETSADETYGAGRYLELQKTSSSTIEVDFNLAYNPYCAYVDDYSCPFPPRENILNIPIKAGEKNY